MGHGVGEMGEGMQGGTDKGTRTQGKRMGRKLTINLSPCPFPMPNAPCPMPYSDMLVFSKKNWNI
ncbi:hypothetical protein A6S26_09510 [Nostoc sp. ATCC 43529]|nr:hypothetical protein A6S26_09510 [Nostoc sp. ATCC 43529]